MKTIGVPKFDSGTEPLWVDLLNASDWLAGGIIVFAGAYWMLGHRAPAIQRLIDGGIGYLIIRHARDVLHWLQSM